MRTRWKVIAASSAVIGGIAILLLAFGPTDPLRAKPRKEWKQTAIAEIQRRTSDTNWLQKEIRTVAARVVQNGVEGSWFSEGLLLFKNGEWMVFTNKCSKEDPRIRDIFIGCGSDRLWGYSTYHFCRNMIALTIEEQPESLAAFKTNYFVRPFDGRSDEGLNKTWR